MGITQFGAEWWEWERWKVVRIKTRLACESDEKYGIKQGIKNDSKFSGLNNQNNRVDFPEIWKTEGGACLVGRSKFLFEHVNFEMPVKHQH